MNVPGRSNTCRVFFPKNLTKTGSSHYLLYSKSKQDKQKEHLRCSSRHFSREVLPMTSARKKKKWQELTICKKKQSRCGGGERE